MVPWTSNGLNFKFFVESYETNNKSDTDRTKRGTGEYYYLQFQTAKC